MRHAKVTKKRDLGQDAVYNSMLVNKLINYIMRDGKKTVAQTQVYDAFEILAKKDPSADSNKKIHFPHLKKQFRM